MGTNGSTCQMSAPVAPKRAARRVVLAGRFKMGARVAEQFRKRGWEVFTVTGAHDVHAAAAETDPHAVFVLETGAEESGYLACAKLRRTQPQLQVVVVGDEWTPERERFAEFVGATFATQDEADGLVNAVV